MNRHIKVFAGVIAMALAVGAVMSAQAPVTITLRYLQTLTEIASEKNSTIIFPLPIELMNLLPGRSKA